MKCPKCEADVVENSVYCHKCGERMDLNAAEPSVAEPTAGAAAGPPEQTATERLKSALESNRNSDHPAEEEIWEGGYCARAMTGWWVLGAAITIALVVVGFLVGNAILWWAVLVVSVLLWGYLVIVFARRRLGVHYRLTTQRFFHEKGILVHTTDLIEVIDMDDITFSQTIIDRLFGVGTVRIVSSDRSHPDLSVPGIENVKEVAAKLHEARHAERLRRGLHIESI